MATYIPKSPFAQRIAKMSKKPVDVLKGHNKNTSGCLICKEFSKYRTTCPTCGRRMLNFGRNVKNPKKGSKTEWHSFLRAYANQIYTNTHELFPCKEYDDLEQRKTLMREEVRRWVYKKAANSLFDQQQTALAKWVIKFDKFLDENYRRK